MMLATIDEAKAHLRIDFDEDDFDIQMKLEEASEIVLDYIKKRDATWDATTVPRPIHAAVLLMLGQLYDDRDAGKFEPRATTPADNLPPHALGYLSPQIAALLHRFRDPALA